MQIFLNLSFCILLVLCFILFRTLISLSKKIKDSDFQKRTIEEKLKRSLEESLELATAEQLLKELRGRSNMPFVLLLPIKEKDYNGITIESHGISSGSCLAMLHLAKAIAFQNLKKNGLDPPKLPPLNDFFE